jgi:hypothetical protein
MKKGFWFFLFLLILCAFIGTALGEIIALLLPSTSSVYLFFTAGTYTSAGPVEIDLILVKLNLGIALQLNLMGILGMIAATIYYLRRI